MELSHHQSLPLELQIMPFQLRCMEAIGLVGPKGKFYRFVLTFGWATFVILLPKSVLGIGSPRLDAIIKGFAELLFECNLFIAVASLIPHLPLLKRLLHVLSEIFRQATDNGRSKDRCYELICEQNSKIDKFCKFYFIYCSFGPLVYCIPAMATSYVRYFGADNGTHNSKAEQLQFELPMEQEFYGLQIRTNFAHYHVFLVVSLSAYYVCSYMSVIKVSTLLIMIKYSALAYRLVAVQIRKLAELPASGQKQNLEFDRGDELKISIMKEAVDLHRKAFEVTDLVEEIINIPIAMQFITCILFWCMTMFYVSTNININLFNIMVPLWLSMIETYGYSYLGTELTEEAKTVGRAIYELPWYEDSAQLQRYYRLMIQRTQRNTGVTAAKFFIVGTEKFGKVVNMSYTYYLVLKDVLGSL